MRVFDCDIPWHFGCRGLSLEGEASLEFDAAGRMS